MEGILTRIFMLLFLCWSVTAIKKIEFDNKCGKTVNAHPAIRLVGTKHKKVNCTVTVKPPGKQQLAGFIRTLNCSREKLQVYDGSNTEHVINVSGIPAKNLCKSRRILIHKEFNSTRNALLFVSDGAVGRFEFLITPYQYGNCSSKEFRCANGRCIDGSLQCNGYNNCGDRSDEAVCNIVVVTIGVTMIVMIIVISVFFVVCVPAAIFYMLFRKRRYYRRF